VDGPDCVVFDLDDTLYLERDYVRSGFRAAGEWARANRGIAGLEERAWRAFERGVRQTIFDHALAEAGIEPEPTLVRALVDVYRAHEPAIVMLPDAVDAIERLRGQVALAAVTDGPIASQRAKARALGVDDWADLAVFTADLGAKFGKPHPRAFELVEAHVERSGTRCAYVADNPAKDFGGPRRLGWRTVRVRRRGSLHAAVDSGPEVDVELPDLRDVQERLAAFVG
jgi:putative hydrolase of the HAD superfamily